MSIFPISGFPLLSSFRLAISSHILPFPILALRLLEKRSQSLLLLANLIASSKVFCKLTPSFAFSVLSVLNHVSLFAIFLSIIIINYILSIIFSKSSKSFHSLALSAASLVFKDSTTPRLLFNLSFAFSFSVSLIADLIAIIIISRVFSSILLLDI